MKARLISIAVFAALAAPQPTLSQEEIYGAQLMTNQERNAYRESMRLAKTEEERERIRAEHHERMLDRAQQRGISLPDQPPGRAGHAAGSAGGGMGPGPSGGGGHGGGPGSSGGSGSGGGGAGGGGGGGGGGGR